MLQESLVDGVLHPSHNLPPTSTNKKTIERRERRKRSKMSNLSNTFEAMKKIQEIYLDNLQCKTPLPVVSATACPGLCVAEPVKNKCKSKEGSTPMAYTTKETYNSASASVTATKSDAATQRDYLISRLQNARYPKQDEMRKIFNLGVDNTPKTYKDLIDVIKKGKYTLDEKITKKIDDQLANEDDEDDICFGRYSPFYGIIWPGPKQDYDGYHKAIEELGKQSQAAQDTIMVSDAAEGLKAIQKFEAWLP